MMFRILAVLSILLLSAPSALGVQRALAPTRGELAGWLAALGIELAYLSLAFIEFDDVQRQCNAARVAKTAVATAIVLNVLADYAARVPAGLTSAAAFLGTFDWLLLALSVLESAPLAGLAYTLAVLLHTRSGKQHTAADAQQQMLSSTQYSAVDAEHLLSIQQQMLQHSAVDAQQYAAQQQCAAQQMLQHQQQYAVAQQHQQYAAQHLRSSAQHPAASAAGAQHSAVAAQYSATTAADASSILTDVAVDTQHTAASADSNTQQMQQHQQYAAGQHRTASFACPRCGAALTQQQYAAARRYGYCARCKRK
jgi:hypothetical protein